MALQSRFQGVGWSDDVSVAPAGAGAAGLFREEIENTH